MTSKNDSLSQEYVTLSFLVEQVLKKTKDEEIIVVDTYFGPAEYKPNSQKIDPDGLLTSLNQFQKKIRTQISEEPRRTYLIKQTDALKLLIRFALEEKVTFNERVRTGLDVDIATVSTERIEELTEQAERALGKHVQKSNLASMAARWRKRAVTSGDEIIPLAQDVANDARRFTQRLLFELPETESVEFRAVKEAPWSAYNYYQGNFQAVIEINTKLPRSKYTLWHWVTHETYPGHQTQLVQRESGYTQGIQNLEATIAIINTPDCTIAEGLAEAGAAILSADRPMTEPEKVTTYLMRLRRAVGINALVMLHQEKCHEKEVLNYLKDLGGYEDEYAQARLPFMLDPMWGPYGFTYFVGAWLVRGFFEAAQEAHLIDEFVKALYYELHTPTTLKIRIRNLELKLPSQLI